MRNDATNIARVILIKVAIAGLPCHVFIFIAVVRWKNMETMWFTLQCVLHENVGGCIITVNLQNLLLTVDLDNPWTVLFYSAGTSIHVSRKKVKYRLVGLKYCFVCFLSTSCMVLPSRKRWYATTAWLGAMALAASSRTAKHRGIHQDNSRSITATVARLHQPQVLANCFGTTIICNDTNIDRYQSII